jgi:hypothetical protein
MDVPVLVSLHGPSINDIRHVCPIGPAPTSVLSANARHEPSRWNRYDNSSYRDNRASSPSYRDNRAPPRFRDSRAYERSRDDRNNRDSRARCRPHRDSRARSRTRSRSRENRARSPRRDSRARSLHRDNRARSPRREVVGTAGTTTTEQQRLVQSTSSAAGHSESVFAQLLLQPQPPGLDANMAESQPDRSADSLRPSYGIPGSENPSGTRMFPNVEPQSDLARRISAPLGTQRQSPKGKIPPKRHTKRGGKYIKKKRAEHEQKSKDSAGLA